MRFSRQIHGVCSLQTRNTSTGKLLLETQLRPEVSPKKGVTHKDNQGIYGYAPQRHLRLQACESLLYMFAIPIAKTIPTQVPAPYAADALHMINKGSCI
jgi:hypothetical protein